MPHRSLKRSGVGALAALVLAACGGGGGGSTPPTGSFDLQTAMLALERSGLTTPVSLSGTASVNNAPVTFTGTGTLTLSAGADGMFAGAAALLQTESISGTLTVGGQSLPYTSSVVDAYDASTGAILGQSQSAQYDVASAPISIPSTVGTSSTALGTLNDYTDSTMSVPIGTTQVSVMLVSGQVDAGGPQIVRFTFQSFDNTQTLIETDTITYVWSADNVLTLQSATAQSAAGTLNVTAQ